MYVYIDIYIYIYIYVHIYIYIYIPRSCLLMFPKFQGLPLSRAGISPLGSKNPLGPKPPTSRLSLRELGLTRPRSFYVFFAVSRIIIRCYIIRHFWRTPVLRQVAACAEMSCPSKRGPTRGGFYSPQCAHIFKDGLGRCILRRHNSRPADQRLSRGSHLGVWI